MNKTITAMSAALLAGASMLAVSQGAISEASAQDNVVNVYNWSDYIDEEVLTKFEEKYGIKVNYDVFDSNEILETKLLTGGTGYDVVVPTGTFLARQIKAGVFQKLDKGKLSNYDNLWDKVLERTEKYDPGAEYSVNYMWGTTGLGINTDMIKERVPDAPMDSWSLLFDPEIVKNFEDCGIHVLDAPTELIPAALNYIGEDPASTDPDVIAKAEPVLQAIRPYIQKFHSSEYINALANGDICLAMGWSGDIFQAQFRADEADNGVNVQYVVPKEGALMWFDQLAIPADAPHPDAAHKFINHLLDAEMIATATNYVWYANGNKASQEHLDPEILSDPAIYPTEDALNRLYVVNTYPPNVQRTVTRLWTRVKTGQ